jgi:uncharacterized protein YjiS (DUF1127 family)
MTMITHPVRDGFLGVDWKAVSHASPLAVAGERIGELVTMLLDWQERARQRRQLLALGDRALQDFGRSRADAASEGDKPFWTA